MSQIPFSSLNLKPELLKNLVSLGYEAMTPIQAQSLPPILAGQDVIAQGKTGSGKTAAFGLGLLAKLDVKNFSVQALQEQLAQKMMKAIPGALIIQGNQKQIGPASKEILARDLLEYLCNTIA